MGLHPNTTDIRAGKPSGGKGLGLVTKGAAHGLGEKSYPGDYSALRRATREAWNWFEAGRLPAGNLIGIHGYDK